MLVFLFIYSCGTRGYELNEEEVILQTLDVAIDSITFGALDSAVLVHSEKYPDNVKKTSLEAFLKKESKVDEQERIVVEKLLFLMQDSVKIKFDDFMFKHNLITENEERSKDSRYFGNISLSNPIVSKNGNIACYYLAINCFKINESGCSVGYLITVDKKDDIWSLRNFYQLWYGSAWKKV